MKTGDANRTTTLKRHLSMFAVWGLSFGYAVGWGAFVMPGATFLPDAGPLGTVIGISVGALAMLAIGWNYHKMTNACPGPSGACLFAAKAFGADYGFLTAWSLSLAYMAILWANATALVLLARYMFGDILQFGWHDTLAGFDIYLGEVLLSVAVMVVAGLVCLWGRRLAGRVQAALAALMLAGVAACFFAALSHHSGGVSTMSPLFAPSGAGRLAQVMRILAMMPWAFVGFEAVSHSSGEFRFPAKKLWWIILASIAATGAMYAMLAVMPALAHPPEYATWADYIKVKSGLSGLDSISTFAAARVSLGKAGVAIIGSAMFAGIFTGIAGATIAMSRLLYSLSANNVLPAWPWLGRLDRNGSPRNAILFVVGISLVIPFFGRTVIGWPVDVSSIGAAVAYCCTSAAAFKFACKKRDALTKATGLAGAVMSIVFCLLLLVPNYLSGSVLSAEAYLVLAIWCIVGFALYRQVFKHDAMQRFGRSPVVWSGIVILVFFSSLMWVRLSSQSATSSTVDSIVKFQAKHCAEVHGHTNPAAIRHEQDFVSGEMEKLESKQLGYDLVQLALFAASLLIIFNLYSIQRRRQEELEVAQAKVEARDRAKSAFLSSVSHDIRTPLNAIVGYIELARRAEGDIGKVREYIGKLEASSHHLLALINDVLEMSRIESGRIELSPVPVDLRAVMEEARDVFAAQMTEKSIEFKVDLSGLSHRFAMCDKSRFNRILLNIVGNAWKFTPAGGRIAVSLSGPEGGVYELRVKDTGIGMSAEFVRRVFDPFELERTSTVNGIEGTGLGMPITKGIVTLMGGTIDVETMPGRGTEFIVRLPLPEAEMPAGGNVQGAGAGSLARQAAHPSPAAVRKSPYRVLLVEDNDINREIGYTLLSQSGFIVDQATNGKEAVEKFARGTPDFYDAILMDVHMPIMDGYTATKTIRAMELPHRPHVPIIALSANAFESDVKAALDAGMDAHIAKPIKIDHLFATLGELVAKRGDAATTSGGASAPEKGDVLDALAAMGCEIEKALRETYVGNRDFYLKMLGKLSSSPLLGKMLEAFAKGDAPALFVASHTLKGLYASLALTPLHALCSDIAEVARQGSLSGIAEKLERLEKLHGEVLAIVGRAGGTVASSGKADGREFQTSNIE